MANALDSTGKLRVNAQHS